jgi:hypothetical protein
MAKNPTPASGTKTTLAVAKTPAAKTPVTKAPAAKSAAPATPVAKSPASKKAATPVGKTKAQPAMKPQPAAAAKPEPTKPAPADKAAKAAKKPAKAQSPKSQSAKSRPVLVRDSFTMPEADFALIAKLKSTALGGRRAAKKSELLRAGLHLLAALDAAALVTALDGLQAVKTGRPKKGH